MNNCRDNVLAVIEVGTTSIRMGIAQVSASGGMRMLDELQQAVSLGRDTLVSGGIQPETTETCVSALRSFRQVLEEYRIGEKRGLRVVATSAVREAANREIFLDRILVGAGMDLEVLDEAEVNRLTYLAVRPQLKALPFFRSSDVLVTEVGGGSTETLLFRKGKVNASHMYRMGSLRLRTLLEDAQPSAAVGERMMRADIAQTVAQILPGSAPAAAPRLLLLGAEIRFAATQLRPVWDRLSICRLPAAELARFSSGILRLNVDALVDAYGLTYPEAETLGPALLIYLMLMEATKAKEVLVCHASLRSGILLEMATGERWTGEFKRQVVNSALSVARKYGVDQRHARHVAGYGLQILQALKKRCEIGERDEIVLHVAALLHETGMAVNSSGYHKHSRYLILNSDVFGLRRRDIELAAVVARYHRRSHPKPSHAEYTSLPRQDRVAVCKLAAVLRIANALERPGNERPMQLEIAIEEDWFAISVAAAGDISVLERRIKECSRLFESVFGMQIVLRNKTTNKTTAARR